MSYKLSLSDEARDSLKRLDRQAATRIMRKLAWFADNADQLKHERLKNPPSELEGVCKYRVGPYRVVYWIKHAERTIVVVDIVWRKGEYRELYR